MEKWIGNLVFVLVLAGCQSGSGGGNKNADDPKDPGPQGPVCCQPVNEYVCSEKNDCRFADFSDEEWEDVFGNTAELFERNKSREGMNDNMGVFSVAVFTHALGGKARSFSPLNSVEVKLVADLLPSLFTSGFKGVQPAQVAMKKIEKLRNQKKIQGDSRWN